MSEDAVGVIAWMILQHAAHQQVGVQGMGLGETVEQKPYTCLYLFWLGLC